MDGTAGAAVGGEGEVGGRRREKEVEDTIKGGREKKCSALNFSRVGHPPPLTCMSRPRGVRYVA